MEGNKAYILGRAYTDKNSGGGSGGSTDLSDYYTKDEVDADINLLSQGIINVTASITAINADITTVNSELDEIDTQITAIDSELGGIDDEIEGINANVQSLSTTMEMYKQKVVRDSNATFAAVDNTDYQWSTSQDSLAVTLPTVTDFTRTHIINLNFIAGSSSPLSVFGSYNTPVDWEFVEGCLYQIELKYIETAWEIKQYCPEKEYASAADLDGKVDVPSLTANFLTEVTISSLGDNEVHGYLGDGSGGVTSFTITEIDQTETGAESIISIQTGDNFTFSYPTSTGVIGSDEMDDNSKYIISVQAGIMVIGKVEVTS